MDYQRLLAGRSAIVTGGAGSIGRAVAMLYASHGANVAILDEDEPGIKTTLRDLLEINQGCFGFAGNLRDPESIVRLCNDAIDALGTADILVNAAGTYIEGDAETLTEDDFIFMIDKNLNSTIRFTKAIIPHMCDNRRGDIVNITSDLATASLAGTAGIAACAGAIAAFTRNVTMDYIRYHVRANCISFPLDGIKGREPLTGTPSTVDVANAALWYACKMSRFIIGDMLPVNGGMDYFVGSEG
ncbi:MAG TPA: SDR family NAD(P)-dependent oxidoreductase [Clostridia bacterium]|nr:SDR family NAD(P)-dependent oxidoreductase [Clostridia bacterium]